MSSNAICYKNGITSKTINSVGYLGAMPPEEATPPDIFSFDQRTKNPRSAPGLLTGAIRPTLSHLTLFSSETTLTDFAHCNANNESACISGSFFPHDIYFES